MNIFIIFGNLVFGNLDCLELDCLEVDFKVYSMKVYSMKSKIYHNSQLSKKCSDQTNSIDLIGATFRNARDQK